MSQPNNDTRPERRSMPVRELRIKSGDGDRDRIEGYAAVFNEETVIGGWFREVIRPGAFARTIKEKQDVRALKNHDPNLLLARTKNGSLSIQEDKRGLWIEFDSPDTSTGRDVVEEIRVGLIDEMSFAFTTHGPDGDKWDETETKDGKLPLRELIDLDTYDVSPVTFAAYKGTEVGLRSAESIYQDHIRSREGQEPEGDDETTPVRQVPSDVDHVVEEILNL